MNVYTVYIAGMIPTMLFNKYYQYSQWNKLVSEDEISNKRLNMMKWNIACYHGLTWPLTWIDYICIPEQRVVEVDKMSPETRDYLAQYIRYMHFLDTH